LLQQIVTIHTPHNSIIKNKQRLADLPLDANHILTAQRLQQF
jgi:hypothetical protein